MHDIILAPDEGPGNLRDLRFLQSCLHRHHGFGFSDPDAEQKGQRPSGDHKGLRGRRHSLSDDGLHSRPLDTRRHGRHMNSITAYIPYFINKTTNTLLIVI